MQQIVLSKPQTAALLGVHLATINRLLKAGKIPKVKLSPMRVGILQTDIDAYLKNQRT